MNRIAFALGVLATAGCASSASVKSGPNVGMSMILPNAADRMSVREKEFFLMPSPIEADLPGYPAAASSSASICAELVVDEDGKVESARQIESGDSCAPLASTASASFGPAVLDAVRKWTFAAAAICRYETRREECDGDDAKLEIVPVKLAYRFDFSDKDGSRNVSQTGLGRRN